MCLLAYEYGQVDESEHNVKLYASPLLSGHNLSFCMRGNTGLRSFRPHMLQANVWSVDYGPNRVPF